MKNVFNEEEPEIMRNLEKRCQVAIEHIADGLNCLKFFDDVDSGEDIKTVGIVHFTADTLKSKIEVKLISKRWNFLKL